MAVAEESGGGTMPVIDESYEFSAPRFFDFVRDESKEDTRRAELWFDTALPYGPSPFMPRIKAGRPFTGASLCGFSEAEETQKMSSPFALKTVDETLEINIQTLCITAKTKEDVTCSEAKEESDVSAISELSAYMETRDNDCKEEGLCLNVLSEEEFVQVGKDACTPNLPKALQRRVTATNSKKQQTDKNISIVVKNPSAMKSSAGTTHLAQENQAIKRQKLEGGITRQILQVKPQSLPHKSKLALTDSNITSSNSSKTHKEDRKVYVRETPKPASVPFVSKVKMMKKFQSSTRDLSLQIINSTVSHGDATSMIQMKPKLTLTRPKEPKFENAQRVRSVRVKSTVELEEEMMAKMPKFKTRLLNMKILQAPTLTPVPRSTPKPPKFKEFELETMARAHQNTDLASIASAELSHKENTWKPHLTKPKTPVLHTSLRARPSKMKSSLELEQEEIEKIPKFKAKPLNKKIFESKGALGLIFCHGKKHVTRPQEFHFATNERIPPPAAVSNLFDQLSLKFDPAHNNNLIPRNTTPNPFHLHTEERGAEKEKKLLMELLQKQLEDERARVPKANPFPFTTDYPMIPPKPGSKQCTKPEPFQLESLVRHEEEIQREMEERQRMEREEAQMRIFKAKPILKEDPIPLPEKDRKPLTQVLGFNVHVDYRSVDRAQFNEKIKEKEIMLKRYREENEAARMTEEMKAIKQLKRTMVHQARPVPNFDHLCPKKSAKERTRPKSPNLQVLHRKEKGEIFSCTVVSSPAAGMR